MAHRQTKQNARPTSPNEEHYEDVKRKLSGIVPNSVAHSSWNGNQDTTIRRTLEIRTIPIVIGIPMDELMHSQFLSNLVCLSIMPWDTFVTSCDTFVTDARNTIHDRFLEKSSAPYLFMIDSDVLPPPQTIETLIAHNLPVVGGWYRKKEKFRFKDVDGIERIIQRPCVYDYSRYNEENDKFEFIARLRPGTGLERVDGMGAGCWMIRRDVAEKVGKSPFNLKNGGEDLSFCRKIYGAGYDIHVDWNLPCAHVGSFYV